MRELRRDPIADVMSVVRVSILMLGPVLQPRRDHLVLGLSEVAGQIGDELLAAAYENVRLVRADDAPGGTGGVERMRHDRPRVRWG
jgi:hypothetical protein